MGNLNRCVISADSAFCAVQGAEKNRILPNYVTMNSAIQAISPVQSVAITENAMVVLVLECMQEDSW